MDARFERTLAIARAMKDMAREYGAHVETPEGGEWLHLNRVSWLDLAAAACRTLDTPPASA